MNIRKGISYYKIKEACPNIRLVRKGVSWVRKFQLTYGNMPANKIQEAEKSAAEKKQIVESYKNNKALDKQSAVIEELFTSVSKYLSRSEEELMTLKTDMLFSFIAYGATPVEYLYCNFEGNGYDYRRQYLTKRDQNLYYCVLNDLIDVSTLNDKAYTSEKFEDFYRRDVVVISDQNNYEDFKCFIEKHPVFIKKNVYANLGIGIELVDIKKYDAEPKEMYDTIVREGKTLLEEILIQDGTLKELNPGSVNTVRIDTVKIRGGVQYTYACLRIGRKGSVVDNAGQLGLVVGINTETGILETNGYNEHGECFEAHPDSHVVLKGIQLPEWNNLLAIVNECTQRLPTLKWVSWDMAYARTAKESKPEWKLVEANGMGDNLYQVAYKHGFKVKMEQLIQHADTMIRL